MAWSGNHMNGYSVAAIPSVAPVVVQPSCTISAISKTTQLAGRRSIRAAISPGITRRVVPPPAAPAPDVSCAIANLLAASRVRGGGVKQGPAPLPVADETRIVSLMPVTMQKPFTVWAGQGIRAALGN